MVKSVTLFSSGPERSRLCEMTLIVCVKYVWNDSLHSPSPNFPHRKAGMLSVTLRYLVPHMILQLHLLTSSLPTWRHAIAPTVNPADRLWHVIWTQLCKHHALCQMAYYTFALQQRSVAADCTHVCFYRNEDFCIEASEFNWSEMERRQGERSGSRCSFPFTPACEK